MCGIIGYCGINQAEPVLLKGLNKLEYRGYDSVGIACTNPYPETPDQNDPLNKQDIYNLYFSVYKEVGKVRDLERLCHDNPMHGNTGIGHCRWATHGEVNWNNAHPHISSDGKVLLVHNGIIENYAELKTMLLEKGFSFSSQSDTETVANLLAYFIASMEPEATHSILAPTLIKGESLSVYVRAMLSLKQWLKGAYALSVMFADKPNEIFAIRCESPLIVGVADQELYVASDILPLAGYTNNIIYLKNHELVYLSRSSQKPELQYYSEDGNLIRPNIVQIEECLETPDKQGYAHFMLKEIYEQPRVFERLYTTNIDATHNEHGRKLPNFGFNLEQDAILKSFNRVVFVGCGTSYHSSLYAAYLFEQYIGVPASVEYASEFRYRHPVIGVHVLVVGLSQSGETADTLAALQFAQKKGAFTLGIVNVPTSSMARLVDLMLCTDCGLEIGVASTKAYTAQMLIMYYLMLYIAHKRNRMPEEEIERFVEITKRLPLLAEQILTQQDTIRNLGRAYAGYQHVLYLGRGLLYSLALEGALKLKELSYIHAEGYAAAEMKHGPIALIDSSMPIVVLAPKHDVLYEKIQNNIAEVKARGGRVFALVHHGTCNDLYDDIFKLPEISVDLDPILFALPLQLFSYYASLARGYDPDQPRNLAKSVTVE